MSDSLTNDALEQMNGKTRKKNSGGGKTRKKNSRGRISKAQKKRIHLFFMQLVIMITTKLKMPYITELM